MYGVKRSKMEEEGEGSGENQNQNQNNTNENQIDVAVADRSNMEFTSINIDCLEELFEWLSLKDLFALRRTCKRLKKVVDYYIKTNYPTVGNARIKESNIQQYFQADTALIKAATVDLERVLRETEISEIEKILNAIEWIHIRDYQINRESDFNDVFLKHCINLKVLWILHRRGNLIGSNDNWLCRHYPTIEHIYLGELLTRNSLEMPKLTRLLNLNPQLQTFAINSIIFLANKNVLINSGIQINQLEINRSNGDGSDLSQVIHMLNELYLIGFYKQLHYYTVSVLFENHLRELATIPAISMLTFSGLISDVCTLPPMPDLKEITYFPNFRAFEVINQNVDLEPLMKNNRQLERIYIGRIYLVSLLPFIRQLPRLKQIKVRKLLSGETVLNDVGIDLEALNKERESLTGACKTTIYVEEDIFLATKFAKVTTSLSLIELKRVQCLEWHKIHPY
ncbi:uncharacterized protein LOC116347653 isoform X2 [Contarinia nasturtii]|nr:uncharacterized protein LOC116347653 isoform X2 [Contarinia nasturtii]XP_031634205.1 uncharacterized protein LOC116347653 isoform X2 [Contarinia nasturtii]